MSSGTTEKMRTIVEYVHTERARIGISTFGRDTKIEGSGLARGSHGDIDNLIDIQLLTTEEGYGSWGELNTPEILDQVYDTVRKRMAWRQRQQ
jgi:hypothetical protein